MPIPNLKSNGYLPKGVHDCSLLEIKERFGKFSGSDRRIQLFEKLAEFVTEAQQVELFTCIIVDGSFVSAKLIPNDIDLIAVLKKAHRFDVELKPFEYNVVSKKRIKSRYPFDVFVDLEDSLSLKAHIELFSGVRQQPDVVKGVLRIWL